MNEQQDYIHALLKSDRPMERKNEILVTAQYILDRFRDQWLRLTGTDMVRHKEISDSIYKKIMEEGM
jgi:hypothetical protein